MVEVVLVRRPGPALVLQALGDDERRVEDRHGHDQQRRGERDRRRRLEHALDRERPEHEAERQRAGVPHEDLRRVVVVAQEADVAPQTIADSAAVSTRPNDIARIANDAAAIADDARRERVHPVDEVHEVRDHRDPDQRQRDAEPRLDVEGDERQADARRSTCRTPITGMHAAARTSSILRDALRPLMSSNSPIAATMGMPMMIPFSGPSTSRNSRAGHEDADRHRQAADPRDRALVDARAVLVRARRTRRARIATRATSGVSRIVTQQRGEQAPRDGALVDEGFDGVREGDRASSIAQRRRAAPLQRAAIGCRARMAGSLLILGAGYLGAAIAARALDAGQHVVLADNWYATERTQLATLDARGADVVTADIRSRADVDALFAVRPDKVRLHRRAGQPPAVVQRPRVHRADEPRRPAARRRGGRRGGRPAGRLRQLAARLRRRADGRGRRRASRTAPQGDLAHLSKIYAELLLRMEADRHGFPLSLLRLGHRLRPERRRARPARVADRRRQVPPPRGGGRAADARRRRPRDDRRRPRRRRRADLPRGATTRSPTSPPRR